MFDWLKTRAAKQSPEPRDAAAASPRVLLDGAYRLHRTEDIARYTALAAAAFPTFAKRITCFGSSWLGCQFATDEARITRGERQILLLEPGTGEALEIPAGLDTFHTGELVEQPDAVAAYGFFNTWRSAGGETPRYDQCVGYRKPLFLGGEDEISNLELSDFEVYWHISAQIIEKVRGLPTGTRINNISIDV
ncbi:MAG: DUF1851 domain-containing protein [Sphingomonas sp.]|uniref:T6SS immunity protein Tdi1 domain-containing protein n=1 Tax=Sphingomonas sp. TaxID=28214 RepID=UPI001AD1B3E2|nr:T6SS immunity protein Tdi1 domain-containing protein [Sphingomonas sp.]MBN8816614.1 DUF1851 domain-containing protein [Sphingomonas sp.]